MRKQKSLLNIARKSVAPLRPFLTIYSTCITRSPSRFIQASTFFRFLSKNLKNLLANICLTNFCLVFSKSTFLTYSDKEKFKIGPQQCKGVDATAASGSIRSRRVLREVTFSVDHYPI
jgi:hypothetical protein